MKKWLVIIGAVFLMCSTFLMLSSDAEAAPAGYALRPGDTIEINVMGFEELNVKPPNGLIIRPDGMISFPFLGEIMVQGLTAGELAQTLTEQLKQYYVNPIVTVNMVKFNTTRVYVLGEVRVPGLYELDRAKHIVDAISAAGGPTKDAAKKKIILVHLDKQEMPKKYNLMDIINKGDLSQNAPLREGDVIYLSGNGRINITQDVLPYISAAYMARYYWRGSR